MYISNCRSLVHNNNNIFSLIMHVIFTRLFQNNFVKCYSTMHIDMWYNLKRCAGINEHNYDCPKFLSMSHFCCCSSRLRERPWTMLLLRGSTNREENIQWHVLKKTAENALKIFICCWRILGDAITSICY